MRLAKTKSVKAVQLISAFWVCIVFTSIAPFYIPFHSHSKFDAKCGKFEFYCFCLRQIFLHGIEFFYTWIANMSAQKKRLTLTKCEMWKWAYPIRSSFAILCFMPDASHEVNKKPRRWHFSLNRLSKRFFHGYLSNLHEKFRALPNGAV